jgi:hypothetical protein
MTLPENKNVLSRAAHKWLREAGEYAPAPYLHLLTLASWGLENGVQGEWPSRDRTALEEQVGLLFGWKPKNVLAWLVSHPNGLTHLAFVVAVDTQCPGWVWGPAGASWRG